MRYLEKVLIMRYLIIVLGLGIIAPQVLAKEKINAFKANQEIIVDGDMSEWTGQKLNHFYDKDISVSVKYDDENIYLLLATRNERSMGILERSGLTVWLNGKNKSKKKIGFQFLGNAGEVYQEFRQAKKSARSQELGRKENKFIDNDKYNQRKEEMKGRFKVVANDNEYFVDSDGTEGPAVICGMHKDVYLIEMKIPFEQKLMSSEISLRPKKNKIAIGLEWMMKRDEVKNRMKQASGSMGGGGGRGGGGMGGGGGRGGGGMGGGGNREMMSKQRELYNDFWVSVTLEK